MALVALASGTARAGIINGVDVGNHIIIYTGTGGHHLAINNFGGDWTGDIGIAGTGTLQATGPGALNGNIHFAANDGGQAHVSNTTIHGAVQFGNSTVQNIMNELSTLSANLGASAGAGTPLAINTNSTQTVFVSGGAQVGGARLFTVNSVNTHNGEDLIVRGDGSQSVVFDVNTPGEAQFHGNIRLQDLTGKFYGESGYAGLTPDQVLFNLYDGDKLSANNNGNHAHPNNIMMGTFLDPNGSISFVNTRFVGRIFGGDSADMQIVSGDTITIPETLVGSAETPAPATVVLALAGMMPCGLASFVRRRFFR
jgi:hypothetical protein